MSNASTPPDSENEEMVKVNFRVSKTFLEEIEKEWQGRGFNSRSEFIRYVLRDAIEYPTFDRDELLALALGEREIREGATVSREEILDEYDVDAATDE